MAEKIPTQYAETNDHFNMRMVLGGRRYSISLRWNEICQNWFYAITLNGERVEGYRTLTPNVIVANAHPCLPPSFGGLYLEQVTGQTGRDAIWQGGQCLWFYHSYEIYLGTGSSRI